jgi:hypothetical protein
MAKDKTLSPYLESPKRLSDVIAAIQAMGTYKYYKLDFQGWADRISADISKADYWRNVFRDHPEFFRLDSNREKASLVWRRQYRKSYHVDSGAEVSAQEYELLMPHERARVSRRPLSPEDITSLINTAIHLHSRALEEQKDGRWWMHLVVAGAALLGAVLGGILSAR